MKTIHRITGCTLALVILLLSVSCSTPQPPTSSGVSSPPPSAHACASACVSCWGCKDTLCTEEACQNKCSGHADGPKAAAYGYTPTVTGIMPSIYINTEDGSNQWATKYNRDSKLAGEIDYVDATVSTGTCGDKYVITDAEAEVKVRGNHTLNYAKKPIRIKFKKKANLFGLHGGEKYKNWVLLADWKDLSMTNNTVAFFLGNTILGSDGYYCTDFRNVEVYLNGKYWGVYLLAEQQEVKDGRTSATEVPDGYTGNDVGYFFEYDGYFYLEKDIPDGDPTFTIDYLDIPARSLGYTVKSDINADSQLEFLQGYMERAFYIAYQATQNDTYYTFTDDYGDVVPTDTYADAKAAVASVIDLQSLVDTYILNEIARDLDVGWSSFYLSLDMSAEGSKLVTFEAPWDFDSCFGIISRDNCSSPIGLYAANHTNPWFRLISDEEWFWEMVREKWAEMKRYGVQERAVELVKTTKATYREYYKKNYTKWSARVSKGNNEVISLLNSYKKIDTAQGLAADYLIDWLTKRFAFLDGEWGQ